MPCCGMYMPCGIWTGAPPCIGIGMGAMPAHSEHSRLVPCSEVLKLKLRAFEVCRAAARCTMEPFTGRGSRDDGSAWGFAGHLGQGGGRRCRCAPCGAAGRRAAGASLAAAPSAAAPARCPCAGAGCPASSPPAAMPAQSLHKEGELSKIAQTELVRCATTYTITLKMNRRA